MPRLASVAELQALTQKVKPQMDLRTGTPGTRVVVHMGTCGIAAGARDVLMALMNELGSMARQAVIQQAGCAGRCGDEPMITVIERDGRALVYGRLDKSKVRRIVHSHLGQGKPVEDLLAASSAAGQ